MALAGFHRRALISEPQPRRSGPSFQARVAVGQGAVTAGDAGLVCVGRRNLRGPLSARSIVNSLPCAMLTSVVLTPEVESQPDGTVIRWKTAIAGRRSPGRDAPS